MDFALSNPILKMPDGTYKHQAHGIPMGDPISPGMTIITCAWLEHKWLSRLSKEDRESLRVARYMDDTLMLVNSTPDGAHTRIMKDFETKCYAPLKLLEASQDTFLETRFELKNNRLKYWLKNDHEGGKKKVGATSTTNPTPPSFRSNQSLLLAYGKSKRCHRTQIRCIKAGWRRPRNSIT